MVGSLKWYSSPFQLWTNISNFFCEELLATKHDLLSSKQSMHLTIFLTLFMLNSLFSDSWKLPYPLGPISNTTSWINSSLRSNPASASSSMKRRRHIVEELSEWALESGCFRSNTPAHFGGPGICREKGNPFQLQFGFAILKIQKSLSHGVFRGINEVNFAHSQNPMNFTFTFS